MIRRVKILEGHPLAGQEGCLEIDDKGNVICDSMFGFARVFLDSGKTCVVIGDQVDLLEPVIVN